MGWVSYAEDIAKRNEEEQFSTISLAELQEQELIRLRAAVNADLRQLRSLLDLATDPSFELVAKYRDSQLRLEDLEQLVQELLSKNEKERRQLEKERSERKRLQAEVDQLSSRLEDLTTSDFGYLRALELHSRHRPVSTH